MLEVVVYGIIWCFAIYGLLVMLQEIIQRNTYKNLDENIDVILTVKNVEKNIENYIRYLIDYDFIHRKIIIIDLESEDDTMCILKRIEYENTNIIVLNKNEGEDYLEKTI